MPAYTQHELFPPDRAWRHAVRILCSGIAFTLFAVGGLLVSILLPIICLLPGGKAHREKRVRGLIRFCFSSFIRLLNALRLIKTHIHHPERRDLSHPAVIIANHPTLIDVVFLYSLLPNCVCVIKEGVWNNPVMALPVRSAGFVPNITGQDLIDQCVENLINGRSIMIFPEGTRSHPAELRDFKRGAAHAALRSGFPVLPVTITSSPPTLAKGRKWYHMADRTCQVVLEFDEPLDVGPWKESDDPESLVVRKLTGHLEKYYAERLEAYYNTM